MITILANDCRQCNFHHLIEKTTNELFGLMKLMTNGSDAKLYAVTSLTQGNTCGCLVACGSYVWETVVLTKLVYKCLQDWKPSFMQGNERLEQ